MDRIKQDNVLMSDLALSKGYCTRQEINKATAIQKKMAAAGETKMLGLILLEEGYIDNMQFIDLLAELEKLVNDNKP